MRDEDVRIGMRVRLVDGRTAKVVERLGSLWVLDLDPHSSFRQSFLFAERFEAMESHGFKVGDRVRVAKHVSLDKDRVGTVDAIYAKGYCPIGVDLGNGEKGVYEPHELEHYTQEMHRRHKAPTPAPAPTGRWLWEFKFEPRDLWLGLFWDRRPSGTHFYVCPLPMLVFHVYPEIR